MIKRTFKGIVNGQEFTSIDDYNAEVMRLLESGEPFQASTSTQVLEENEPEDEAKPIEVPPTGEYCEEPGEPMSTDVLKESLQKILDRFTGGPDDKFILKNFNEFMDQNMNMVYDTIGKFSIDDLIKFVLSLKGEADVIKAMADDNCVALTNSEDLIGDIAEEIEDLKRDESDLQEELKAVQKELKDVQDYLDEREKDLDIEKNKVNILRNSGSLLTRAMTSYRDSATRASERLKELGKQ